MSIFNNLVSVNGNTASINGKKYTLPSYNSLSIINGKIYIDGKIWRAPDYKEPEKIDKIKNSLLMLVGFPVSILLVILILSVIGTLLIAAAGIVLLLSPVLWAIMVIRAYLNPDQKPWSINIGGLSVFNSGSINVKYTD